MFDAGPNSVDHVDHPRLITSCLFSGCLLTNSLWLVTLWRFTVYEVGIIGIESINVADFFNFIFSMHVWEEDHGRSRLFLGDVGVYQAN